MCIFGFMRVGEFTADSKNHIQDSVLLLSDVTFSLVCACVFSNM